MNRRSRRAQRGRTPSTSPPGRLRRWANLLVLSTLSLLAILCTQGPGSEADAQPPARAAKDKLPAPALARIIDQHIQTRLTKEGIPLSPLADDAEFLRRVYLDLTGRIPPAEKVTAFLDSKDANKRAKVIEELLANPRFGSWMAETWTNVMVKRESNNRALKSKPLLDWLAEGFNANKPWDKLVYELITATGDQDKNGAVTYFIGNPTVDKMTDSVTRLFLGVRLECAQCHNHPFTSYKQNEYWAMAQFFMKVRLTANPQQASKKGISPGIVEGGKAKGKGKKKGLPESAKIVPAKFLQGAQPKLNPLEPARPVLAKWLVSPDNPFFARAMVNRLWGHFFGRGLVNPVDDMHGDNPASHPELLATLSEQFKQNGFNVKYLVRAIVNSKTYQRSSRPQAANAADTELFSHAAVRGLTPEQLYDSLTAIVGQPGRGAFPKKKVGAKKGPFGPREQFVNFFRIEDGADSLEYQAGIPQALRLMNSPLLNNTGPVVTQAMSRGGGAPARVVEQLYVAILSRRPTPEESQRRVAYVRRQADARSAYGDLAWALLNSSEFAFNH